jgi:hypothetical protein
MRLDARHFDNILFLSTSALAYNCVNGSSQTDHNEKRTNLDKKKKKTATVGSFFFATDTQTSGDVVLQLRQQ